LPSKVPEASNFQTFNFLNKSTLLLTYLYAHSHGLSKVTFRSFSMSETMRPPINRAMRVLDRSFFKKTVPLAAARIFNNQHISQCRQALQKSNDLLRLERGATSIRADPSPELGTAGKKCLLLREEIKVEGEAVTRRMQISKS